MPSPETEAPRDRLTILMVLVGTLFLSLLVRLWFLQVVDVRTARAAAAAASIQVVLTPAPRGNIVSAGGKLLAGTVEEPVLEVARADLTDTAMLGRLSALTGTSIATLDAAVKNQQVSPFAPVPVAQGATPQEILYVEENRSQFPGVTVTTVPMRTYTKAGIAAANILGYTGPVTAAEYRQLKGKVYAPTAVIGQAGVEATYNSVLMGKPGVTRLEVDSRGQVLGVLSRTPPVSGHTLRLTISAKLQQLAVSTLNTEIALKRTQVDPSAGYDYRATSGSMVVEDPSNGTILALATVPDYNPQQFIGGISTANYAALTNPANNSPLEDRAISGEYFPGSTFKVATATAGLQSGVITPTSFFNDQGGGITIGGHFFGNAGRQSFGQIQLPFAIAVSDDAYFYNIGAKLNRQSVAGNNFLQKVAGEYGFAKPTGIALPGESTGYVLTPALKAKLHKLYPKAYPYGSWYVGDNVQSAIGQDDVTVTPLQMANAYATFANGGTRYVPRIAAYSETAQGKIFHSYTSKVATHVSLTAAQHQAMVAGFVGAANNPLGTAYGSFGKTNYPIQVAGKTGTAQVVNGIPHTSPLYKEYTSVFTSFAPASNPRYVIDCFIPQGGYGADAAAPAVRQMYDVLFHQPILATPLSGY